MYENLHRLEEREREREFCNTNSLYITQQKGNPHNNKKKHTHTQKITTPVI